MSNICSTTFLIFLPTQDQYVFIHDAVLESVVCGDTQIPASGLSSAIEQLKQMDSETGKTGFQTQLHVCHIPLALKVHVTSVMVFIFFYTLSLNL